jgi:acyl-CoA thioester hydrolase
MRLHVPTPLRWSDLDAYGHVNNARMLSLLEEARIQAFWVSDDTSEHAVGASTAVLDATPGATTITLIARQEIEYLHPVPYGQRPLDVQLWIGGIGGSSVEVCYEVWSPQGEQPQALYARATAVVVLVDTASGRPTRWGSAVRTAWAPFVGEPIVYGRRR